MKLKQKNMQGNPLLQIIETPEKWELINKNIVVGRERETSSSRYHTVIKQLGINSDNVDKYSYYHLSNINKYPALWLR